MSKGRVFQEQMLDLILNNIPLPLIGDATGLVGSTVDGDIFIALHTSDPGEAGDQETNEVTTGEYVGYTRLAVVRDDTKWTISSGVSPATGKNTASLAFPLGTGGTGATITHISAGYLLSGAGKIFYSGTCPDLVVGSGVTPTFAADACVFTED